MKKLCFFVKFAVLSPSLRWTQLFTEYICLIEHSSCSKSGHSTSYTSRFILSYSATNTSNRQFISNLSSVLSHLKPSTKCFMCGDFNYDLLQAQSKYTSRFSETMFDYCYYSLINKPTRTTSSSETVLDHVWTNIYLCLIKAKILLHLISDHLPLLTCYEATSIKVFKIQRSECSTQKISTTFTIH